MPSTNATGHLLNATEMDHDNELYSQCIIFSCFKQYILCLNPVCASHFYAIWTDYVFILIFIYFFNPVNVGYVSSVKFVARDCLPLASLLLKGQG